MADTGNIRFFEELSINAWPSLHIAYDDGWVLRAAGGYTRRANCVNPLYAAVDDLSAKVERAEAWYGARGQETVFKLTDAAQPPGLNDLLVARGYQEASRSHVMRRSLDRLDAPDARPLWTASAVQAEWLTAFCRMHDYDLAYYLPLMTAMLERLAPPACFAAIEEEGQMVAVGLGVLERGYVGIYDLVTDSYLMVASGNEPALRLYAGLGYERMYSYWYQARQ